jgi:hypothetical protein
LAGADAVAVGVYTESHRLAGGEESGPLGPAPFSGSELGAQHRALSEQWDALCAAAATAVKQATVAHELYRKPNPGCELCGGSGRRRTAANPNGFWDSWEIGGCWAGIFDPDYDQSVDGRNYAPCSVCDPQTRKRYFRTELSISKPKSLGGLFAREKDGMWESQEPTTREDPMAEEAECNSCHGTGMERSERNVRVASDAKPVSETPVDFSFGERFHALVTPDGQWHHQGRMGWSGTTHRELDDETWVTYVDAEVAKHPDSVAIVVDCHT